MEEVDLDVENVMAIEKPPADAKLDSEYQIEGAKSEIENEAENVTIVQLQHGICILCLSFEVFLGIVIWWPIFIILIIRFDGSI